MKKILAFAGSTSSTSINKQLVTFTAKSLTKTNFDIIDFRDFTVPMYSEDEQKENGIPEDIVNFSKSLDTYDGFMVSLAEHNGSYAAAFKNIFDWCSVVNGKIFREKPVLLMATSPGAMGGRFVLAAAEQRFPRHAAKPIFTFSLPTFSENFKEDKITNTELLASLQEQLAQFENAVNQ
ncbi:NAD(P)H-dependent oxidoreductase [uncultured Polaribacter sp.]|uniref:NADPH-dependent FMN reductase n=1 Tax=uncultured Polaribacter sp. TaxID=174711 RepID=UPI002616DF9E|nr:NAD(P)H-dependent oxidoreductase [uncultured Polaribacter sp.]